MKWIGVRPVGGEAEFVDLDKVLSIQFVTRPDGVEVVRLLVVGGGEKLIAAGEVDDADTLDLLRQLVGIGERPFSLPRAAAGTPRPA